MSSLLRSRSMRLHLTTLSPGNMEPCPVVQLLAIRAKASLPQAAESLDALHSVKHLFLLNRSAYQSYETDLPHQLQHHDIIVITFVSMSSEAGGSCVTVKFVSDAPDLIVDIDRGATAAALTEEVGPCAHDALMSSIRTT